MRDDLRRMAMFGSGVAELTRHRAEQIARDLVERSKQNRDEVMRLVKGEIQNQIASLGVPSKRDIERLQRRVERLEGQVKEAREAAREAARNASKAATGGKTSTPRKTGSAKKTSARKTTAAKSSATRTNPSKTTGAKKTDATSSGTGS